MAPFVTSSDFDRSNVCEKYKPLVLSTVKKLDVVPQSWADAIQEGMIGLLSAYDHYDFESPVQFGVFARNYVKGAVIRGVFAKEKNEGLTFVGNIYNLDVIHNRSVVDRTDVKVEHLAVRKWRDSLEFDDRWIINRMFWDDATSTEVATELKRTVHWVNERRAILFERARTQLKAS